MKLIVSLLICCFLTLAIADTSSIQLDVFAGSNEWWIALAVRNAGVDTRTVQIKQSQSDSWETTSFQSGWGYFTLNPNGQLKFPLSIQLTSADGNVVTINNIIPSSAAGIVDAGVAYGGVIINPATGAPTVGPPVAAATTAPIVVATQAPTTAPTTAPASGASGCAAPMKVMVPLYTYPGASWDAVAATGRIVPTVAIINPNSGPGNGPDSSYNTYMNKLHEAGVEMVGYVHTLWGARDINVVKAEIDIYASQFPLVVGIFLDEGAAVDAQLPYYQQLYEYIMNMPGWKYDIINPGTVPTPGYVNAATQIVTFEDVHTKFSASTTPAYASCENKDKFSVITYGGSSSDMTAAVITARSKGYYGWFYMTDGAGGCCTYNALTSYYGTMATYIASTN